MLSILLLQEKKEKVVSHKKRKKIATMTSSSAALISRSKGNIHDIAECLIYAIKTEYISLNDFEQIYKKVKARLA